MTSIVVRPHTYDVVGRTRGSGPVLAVLTDAPTDLIVAAHAADLAARTGTLLIAAATVHTTGCSVNALLHHARDRRIRTRGIAIVARVTPILHAAAVAYFRSTLLVPTGTDTGRPLPTTAVHRLVDRFGAVTVITALPLHDPTGILRAGPHHD
ncbi:hypothetical protein [Actinoplanes sp. NPDC049599]|uniref:hypothetical protein n=1 Tax=Actinoplanes sp. NPDC049599 TaxID=3363903 RepID=UPI00379A681F